MINEIKLKEFYESEVYLPLMPVYEDLPVGLKTFIDRSLAYNIWEYKSVVRKVRNEIRKTFNI